MTFGITGMIEGKAIRAGCRHVDGIDAAEDERTGLRNVTGARTPPWNRRETVSAWSLAAA